MEEVYGSFRDSRDVYKRQPFVSPMVTRNVSAVTGACLAVSKATIEMCIRDSHVTSKQYKQMNPAAADRPAYSILDNYMMRLADGYQMADWKDALDAVSYTHLYDRSI